MNRNEFSEALRCALLDAIGQTNDPLQATILASSQASIGTGLALKFDLGGITIDRMTVEVSGG